MELDYLAGLEALDVFPAHFGLEALESITSYMMRLMAENSLYSIPFFAQNIYGKKGINRLYGLRDFPPTSWGGLCAKAMQSEGHLLDGTFYWLIKKFRNYEIYQKRMQRFLSNSIASNLRFCPLCLQEKNYYRLLWRFIAILGCSDHNVFLLESCPSCKTELKVFANTRIFGTCNKCGFDLRNSRTEFLPFSDSIRNKNRANDFTFLISPHLPDEFSLNGIPDFGARFYYFRRQSGLSVVEVADKVGFRPFEINILERNNQNYLPGNFENLLKFLDLIGINFQTFFSHEIDKHLIPNIKYMYVDPVEEGQTGLNKDDALCNQLRQAYSELSENNQEVTQDMVCKMVGIGKRTIRRFSESRRFLAEIAKKEGLRKRQKKHENTERKIYSEVEKAINELKAITPILTIKEIAAKSGYTLGYLRHYPSVRQLLEPFVRSQYRVFRPSIEEAKRELLIKFHCALQQLESQGIIPKIKLIAQLCGVSESYLRNFPEIRIYFSELASKRAETIDETLYVKMKQTYEEMKSTGTYTSISDLCERLSISNYQVKRYIKVRHLVKQIEEGKI